MLSNMSVKIEKLVVDSLNKYYPRKLIVNINRMISDKKQNDLDNIDFQIIHNNELKKLFVFLYVLWSVEHRFVSR